MRTGLGCADRWTASIGDSPYRAVKEGASDGFYSARGGVKFECLSQAEVGGMGGERRSGLTPGSFVDFERLLASAVRLVFESGSERRRWLLLQG